MGAACVRRRRRQGASVDPLGAGNTALVSALGGSSQVIGFWDVRKNVTVSGATVTAWDDVRGSSGFGPTFVGTGHAPAWDATNLIISNATSSQYLVTAATAALDYSGGISLVYVGSVPATATNYVFGLSASGATTRFLMLENVAGVITGKGQGNVIMSAGGSVASGAVIRCVFLFQRTTSFAGMMVPNTALSSAGTGGAPTVGNNLLSVFGLDAGSINTGAQCRAVLAIPGDITAGGTVMSPAMTAIDTWAKTHHTSADA